jgi:hypothetical protein
MVIRATHIYRRIDGDWKLIHRPLRSANYFHLIGGQHAHSPVTPGDPLC